MKSDESPKERILNKAYELFYTQGYNVTGINQILDEAKVAKASLYQHFGSKEDLGVEYIKKVRDDWFKAFNNYLSRTDDPKEKLLATFDFLSHNMKLNNFRGCRFLNLLTEIDDANDVIQNQIKEHKTKLREAIKSMVLKYVEKRPVTINLADTIYLLFEAAITESKLYKNTWPITTAKKTTEVLLTKMV